MDDFTEVLQINGKLMCAGTSLCVLAPTVKLFKCSGDLMETFNGVLLSNLKRRLVGSISSISIELIVICNSAR